jgi:serine/threonine protein kinase
MAETFGFDMDKIKAIIQSNNTIKRTTHTYVKDFLTVQAEFLEKVNEIYDRLDTVEHVANIFIDQEKIDILDEYQPLEQVQLAVCGYNNTGKTSFIHELLGLGDFLPAGEGAVTARIVKFSYTPAETACLIKYTSVNDSTEVGNREDLSNYFMSNITKKVRTKGLRKLIREHLARPEDMDKYSDAFAEWAKTFIEIRIPAPILELGLHIYDTPGFLGSDPPVLRDNLLDLVHRVHPTLVFLYDNAVVSDDSRKCYEKLKEALRSQLLGVDIFFLNTKADVAVIRKNASNADDNDDDADDTDADDDDDEKLLENERLYRYSLLLEVNEMKGDINNANLDEQVPSLEKCQCFDIFSTVSPADPMEKLIKRRAIDRIINYAAEHDLKPTKLVINITHKAIDTFFDFVLITNRRSRDEWEKLRDEALEWGNHFFKQYRDIADHIAAEANRRLPQRFLEKYEDIKERSMKDCETGGIQWNERLDSVLSAGSSRRYNDFIRYRVYYRRLISMNRASRSHEQEFVDMLVERDVIKPILQQIISQESEHIKQTVNEMFTCYRNKNELLYAAHREVLIDIGDLSDPNHISIQLTLIKTIVLAALNPLALVSFVLESLLILSALPIYFIYRNNANKHLEDRFLRRKQFVLSYLAKLENILSTMGDCIKKQMIEWIDDEHKKFRNKVNGYFKIVCRTIGDRQRAYELARSFAPRFARIECRLEANLNLAAHHGSRPVIHHQEVLGTGGFFNVHPASWDGKNELVAKKLRDHITNQDFAYLEAHFHRTVTSLNISHMVHLKYLYEENDSSLYLLLPRYDTDLHSFLETNMKKMTADKAIQISRDIAGVIAHMHAHDLVHRDIKVQNILMDKQEQVYLADFGTCQHGTENTTFIGSRPLAPDLTTVPSTNASSSSSSHEHSYQGTAVDVYSLGMLMYACAPKDTYVLPCDNTAEQIHLLDRRRVPENYCQLITRCLNKDFKKRPTAKQIVDELDAMAKQLCIMCEDAPRFVRFIPCGHKVVCVGCLDQIQQKSDRRQCIVCNQVFTSTREDNDTNTFIAASKNST